MSSSNSFRRVELVDLDDATIKFVIYLENTKDMNKEFKRFEDDLERLNDNMNVHLYGISVKEEQRIAEKFFIVNNDKGFIANEIVARILENPQIIFKHLPPTGTSLKNMEFFPIQHTRNFTNTAKSFYNYRICGDESCKVIPINGGYMTTDRIIHVKCIIMGTFLTNLLSHEGVTNYLRKKAIEKGAVFEDIDAYSARVSAFYRKKEAEELAEYMRKQAKAVVNTPQKTASNSIQTSNNSKSNNSRSSNTLGTSQKNAEKNSLQQNNTNSQASNSKNSGNSKNSNTLGTSPKNSGNNSLQQNKTNTQASNTKTSGNSTNSKTVTTTPKNAVMNPINASQSMTAGKRARKQAS